MKFWRCIILFSIICSSLLADTRAYECIGIAGSFNFWNQTDEDYLMKFEGNNVYEIKKFFDKGITEVNIDEENNLIF